MPNKRFNVGPFGVTKLGGNRAAYEVWFGMEYVGLVSQCPETGKWAMTHNAVMSPRDRRYIHDKPSGAVKAGGLTPIGAMMNAEVLDTGLEPSPAFKEPKKPDPKKLMAQYNDPMTSVGIKAQIKKKLAEIGIEVA